MSAPKAGALYFALLFAAGWVLGPIRELVVVPRLGRTAGLFLEAPLMLLAMFLAARWIVRRLEAPRGAGARAAVGLIALAILLGAEYVSVRWVRGLEPAAYLATFNLLTGGLVVALYLLFAAMPLLVERR